MWRYTPWRRVHPSKVEEIPDASALSISLGESGSMLEESNEIARAFLGECSAETRDISLNDEKSELELVATGEITCSSLRINSVGVSVLRIRLSGNPKWVGLRIEGVVSGTLSVVLINDLGADVHLLRCEDWDIKRDSLLELATLSYGGFLIKSDIRANLLESGAQFTGGIASHGHVARHDDHHVEISHMGKHTNSSLIVHSACGDSSHSIGTGLLKIGEDANGSDAGQVFRNILFSEKARADSIPELEVLSDDVKAAHGAASAPVDKEQVHYLMSRGLNNSESESLIIEGFLMDAFREIKNTTILDAIRTRLLVHLDCLVKG
ncbi:MAG: SufD family Fe-S cluster assembly protein [Candidatus Poseidoniaceae archaeon]|nr:SufD family Fe-S cluster assembly protein [Candidatus Poseidoniaceae archaeon]